MLASNVRSVFRIELQNYTVGQKNKPATILLSISSKIVTYFLNSFTGALERPWMVTVSDYMGLCQSVWSRSVLVSPTVDVYGTELFIELSD